MQANIQSENAQVEFESATTVENSYFGQMISNSLILLCYESELSLHSWNFVIEVLLFTSIFLQISIHSFLMVMKFPNNRVAVSTYERWTLYNDAAGLQPSRKKRKSVFWFFCIKVETFN